MEETKKVDLERKQIKNERLLYQIAEEGIFDYKTQYEIGKEVLLSKLEYMPEGDTLTEKESNFVAKNYPELVDEFSEQFNWSLSSSEIAKWGDEESIKKNFDKLDFRQCMDTLQNFQPELFEKLKSEIFKKASISLDKTVPKIQVNSILENLKSKGFDKNDKVILELEKLAESNEKIIGMELMDVLSNIEEKEGYLEGIKFDYTHGEKILKQSGLYLDEKGISIIKVNDKQNIQVPLMGKGYNEIKSEITKLLQGEQTGLIEGLRNSKESFDAKLQLLINPTTGKMQIRGIKKAHKLSVPEELSESEIQKLKNGQSVVLSRGFLFNYRTAQDKTSLMLRKIIADHKKSVHEKQEVSASMRLDKELNRLVVSYVIKEENKKSDVVATVLANGKYNPVIYLQGNNKKEDVEKVEKVKKGINNAVSKIKHNYEESIKEPVKNFAPEKKEEKGKSHSISIN